MLSSPCTMKAPLAMIVSIPSNAPSYAPSNEFSTSNLLESHAEVVNRLEPAVSDTIYLHFQDVNCFNKKHILSWCLVGRWGDDETLSFAALKDWISTHWC